jgi:L-ascorbate metabolism protein UlaG (beta-lactamase superfamily)
MSWFGVANLAASFDGHVVLLDTFIDNRAEDNPPYIETDVSELTALRPEAIFIGHAHFDHTGDVGRVVKETQAPLVGLPEHCNEATRQLDTLGATSESPKCVEVLPSASQFGDAAVVEALAPDIRVTAIRHPHSGPASTEPTTDPGSSSVMYLFEVGDFSLLWNDTAGPLREHAPQLPPQLRSEAPVDVHFGAIAGFGYEEQGLRDPVDYMEATRAKVFYPLHHDFFVRGSPHFEPELHTEMASRQELDTELVWLQDPASYLEPIAFDPTDRRWKE